MCTSKFNAIDHHLDMLPRCALIMCCIAYMCKTMYFHTG